MRMTLLARIKQLEVRCRGECSGNSHVGSVHVRIPATARGVLQPDASSSVTVKKLQHTNHRRQCCLTAAAAHTDVMHQTSSTVK